MHHTCAGDPSDPRLRLFGLHCDQRFKWQPYSTMPACASGGARLRADNQPTIAGSRVNFRLCGCGDVDTGGSASINRRTAGCDPYCPYKPAQRDQDFVTHGTTIHIQKCCTTFDRADRSATQPNPVRCTPSRCASIASALRQNPPAERHLQSGVERVKHIARSPWRRASRRTYRQIRIRQSDVRERHGRRWPPR
jgi:hypothetical protein